MTSEPGAEGGAERGERRRSDSGSAEYAAMMEGDDGDMAACGFGIGGHGGADGDAGLWNMQAANLFFANFSFKNLSQLATFNIDLVLRHHQAEKEQSKELKAQQQKAAEAAALAAAAAGSSAASPAATSSPVPVPGASSPPSDGAVAPTPMDSAPSDSGGGFARLSPAASSPGADSVSSGTPQPATPEQPRA
jgi:hypothetical protein